MRQVFTWLCLESKVNFSDLLVHENNFNEYAKVSVDGPLEPYFKNFISMNQKSEADAFNKACTYLFQQILNGCTTFGAKRGSPDRSFMVLLMRIQTDEEKMRTAVAQMPESLQADKPNIFHRLIVDSL